MIIQQNFGRFKRFRRNANVVFLIRKVKLAQPEINQTNVQRFFINNNISRFYVSMKEPVFVHFLDGPEQLPEDLLDLLSRVGHIFEDEIAQRNISEFLENLRFNNLMVWGFNLVFFINFKFANFVNPTKNFFLPEFCSWLKISGQT